jgi:hypothetical protein
VSNSLSIEARVKNHFRQITLLHHVVKASCKTFLFDLSTFYIRPKSVHSSRQEIHNHVRIPHEIVGALTPINQNAIKQGKCSNMESGQTERGKSERDKAHISADPDFAQTDFAQTELAKTMFCKSGIP